MARKRHFFDYDRRMVLRATSVTDDRLYELRYERMHMLAKKYADYSVSRPEPSELVYDGYDTGASEFEDVRHRFVGPYMYVPRTDGGIYYCLRDYIEAITPNSLENSRLYFLEERSRYTDEPNGGIFVLMCDAVTGADIGKQLVLSDYYGTVRTLRLGIDEATASSLPGRILVVDMEFTGTTENGMKCAAINRLMRTPLVYDADNDSFSFNCNELKDDYMPTFSAHDGMLTREEDGMYRDEVFPVYKKLLWDMERDPEDEDPFFSDNNFLSYFPNPVSYDGNNSPETYGIMDRFSTPVCLRSLQFPYSDIESEDARHPGNSSLRLSVIRMAANETDCSFPLEPGYSKRTYHGQIRHALPWNEVPKDTMTCKTSSETDIFARRYFGSHACRAGGQTGEWTSPSSRHTTHADTCIAEKLWRERPSNEPVFNTFDGCEEIYGMAYGGDYELGGLIYSVHKAGIRNMIIGKKLSEHPTLVDSETTCTRRLAFMFSIFNWSQIMYDNLTSPERPRLLLPVPKTCRMMHGQGLRRRYLQLIEQYRPFYDLVTQNRGFINLDYDENRITFCPMGPYRATMKQLDHLWLLHDCISISLCMDTCRMKDIPDTVIYDSYKNIISKHFTGNGSEEIVKFLRTRKDVSLFYQLNDRILGKLTGYNDYYRTSVPAGQYYDPLSSPKYRYDTAFGNFALSGNP